MRAVFRWVKTFKAEKCSVEDDTRPVTLEHGPSKGWSGVHLLHDNASSHKCEVVMSF